MASEAQKANKREALDALKGLRFNKKNKVGQNPTVGPSGPASNAPSPPGYGTPPAQSRDASGASVPSRHFSSQPPPPTPFQNEPKPFWPPDSPSHQPFGAPQRTAVAQPTHHYQPPTSVRLGGRPPGDLLSQSSGFTSSNGSLHSQFAYNPAANARSVPSSLRPPATPAPAESSAASLLSSPTSPEIHQRKRKRVAGHVDLSDDELEDPKTVMGMQNSRLERRQEAEKPPSSSESQKEEEEKFKRFKIIFPTESNQRVAAAWAEANGDTNAASNLLLDQGWQPKPSPVKKAPKSTRVDTIAEQNRAKRADERERGNKSLIYAKLPKMGQQSTIQRSSTTTPVKTAIPSHTVPIVDLTSSPTASSPITPVLPRRRRLYKRVVDSDSEKEFEGSDDEEEDNDNGRGYHRPSGPDPSAIAALKYFNDSSKDAIQELTGCSPQQAETIESFKPFDSIDDLSEKLGQGRKKAGPSGISPHMFEECVKIFRGYDEIDGILSTCERIGADLRRIVLSWTGEPADKGKEKETIEPPSNDDGSLNLRSLSTLEKHNVKEYMSTQPRLLSDSVQLKEYQILGLNWLNLLYEKNHSCILADEMGLGKTIQVISFIALLKERGRKGPNLIVVPSSTLENWCREFDRFAPDVAVQTYYASKKERIGLQDELMQHQRSNDPDGWEVLITTYTLAQTEGDRRFLRKFDWDCCIFDEGHVLKNFQSQRYESLMKYSSRWRLLLTGTPLQNNLQELVSLMAFILPEQFSGLNEEFRAVFKAKGDAKALLARERVSRAKKMMTPFVLRRRKDQVLQDLPKKVERVEYCDMNVLQRTIYVDAMQRSRKTIYDLPPEAQDDNSTTSKAKKKPRPKDKMYLENSSNVLMDLRKASSHPMLFRARFTDEILTGMTKELLKEPDFVQRGALFELVKEDMSVMTDSELQVFCEQYKSLHCFRQEDECFQDSGKIQTLLKLLERYQEEGRKMLVFSQFTQILDIIQVVLRQKNIKFLVLTGSTPVDVRQSLVDEFGEDGSIPVFLLSTKAGGMGINLTAASVVVIFDQDFNPHNDKQAQDRAYRIGQKRDVEVIKLISKGTIEQDMYRLAQTKLALDEAVAGDSSKDSAEKDDNDVEREMKTSLLDALRKQFEDGEDKMDTST